MGYPEDRDRAEERLAELEGEEAGDGEKGDGDEEEEAVIDD